MFIFHIFLHICCRLCLVIYYIPCAYNSIYNICFSYWSSPFLFFIFILGDTSVPLLASNNKSYPCFLLKFTPMYIYRDYVDVYLCDTHLQISYFMFHRFGSIHIPNYSLHISLLRDAISNPIFLCFLNHCFKHISMYTLNCVRDYVHLCNKP